MIRGPRSSHLDKYLVFLSRPGGIMLIFMRPSTIALHGDDLKSDGTLGSADRLSDLFICSPRGEVYEDLLLPRFPPCIGSIKRHYFTSMHFLQSVLLWNSCESFAWFAGTASPHSA